MSKAKQGTARERRADQREREWRWARVVPEPSPEAYVAEFGGSLSNATRKLNLIEVKCVDRQWIPEEKLPDPIKAAARGALEDLFAVWRPRQLEVAA